MVSSQASLQFSISSSACNQPLYFVSFFFFFKQTVLCQTILLTLNYSGDRAFQGIVMTRAHRFEGGKKCFSEKVMIEIFILNDSLD